MDNLITDARLKSLGVVHGMTTAHWGHMKHVHKRHKFFTDLKIPPENILNLKQVHGNDILTVCGNYDLNRYKSGRHKADGWILAVKNCGVSVYTADCLPLFLWDKNADVLALAHCGWRNIAEGFPSKIAKSLISFEGAKMPVSALIAPHIQKCCFEVDKSVYRLFTKSGCKKTNGKFCVDLSLEVKYQLISAGIEPADIQVFDECTFCNPQKYFSYRRTGKKLSMISFVYKN